MNAHTSVRYMKGLHGVVVILLGMNKVAGINIGTIIRNRSFASPVDIISVGTVYARGRNGSAVHVFADRADPEILLFPVSFGTFVDRQLMVGPVTEDQMLCAGAVALGLLECIHCQIAVYRPWADAFLTISPVVGLK